MVSPKRWIREVRLLLQERKLPQLRRTSSKVAQERAQGGDSR